MTLNARRKAPGNMAHLERLIAQLAGAAGGVRRFQRAIANTVVGQMLPPSVVKGGTAMKLRFGESGSRFTPDLDVARQPSLTEDAFVAAFAESLREGWAGFTGTIEADARPAPPGVPDDYIMSPFRIRLAYKGRHWLSVPFELGRDEVGSTLVAEPRLADDIAGMFEGLGLPVPDPVPLMPAPHQVAQKLHACTAVHGGGGNERAHDLVDLQLLDREGFDIAETATVARKLFASRRAQDWPPTVVAQVDWEAIYAEASDGLDVIGSLDDAIFWANELVVRIDAVGDTLD